MARSRLLASILLCLLAVCCLQCLVALPTFGTAAALGQPFVAAFWSLPNLCSSSSTMGFPTVQDKLFSCTPAAKYIVAFQIVMTFRMVLSALALMTGWTDDFYKLEPHTKKIVSPDSRRLFEIGMGGHLLHWAAGMAVATMAGGAQFMCVLQLPPMLACTYYHYACGAMPNVKANCIFMMVSAYLGLASVPVIPHIQWTSAACFLTFQASLIFLPSLVFLSGHTEGFYKSSPHAKQFVGNRSGELLLGGVLMGMAVGITGAVMAGAARDMCIFELPPLLVCTYVHYAAGSTKDTVVDSVFMLLLAYFGFVC